MKKLLIATLFLSGTYIFSSCNGNGNSSSTTSSDSSSTNSSSASGTASNADTSMNKTDASTNKMQNDSANMSKTPATPVDNATMDFANKAATGGMLEVELGKLAQDKASSQQVKDFGKMMVDDHTLANNNFMSIAKGKNITLPAAVTSDQQKEIDDLSKKTGKDFDKAYVKMMVDDHKDDIKEFKDAQGKVADNDVKNFIVSTLPTLQKHLDAIQAIKAKM